MKPFIKPVLIFVVGGLVGIGLSVGIFLIIDDWGPYSPDSAVNTILERGTIVGEDSGMLSPAKGMVTTSFWAEDKQYFRQFIESPRFALLLTTEDSVVIEAEIWDRKNYDSVFYEIDTEGMKRYYLHHDGKGRNPIALES